MKPKYKKSLVESLLDPIEGPKVKALLNRIDPKAMAELADALLVLDNGELLLTTAGDYEGLQDMAMGAGRFSDPVFIKENTKAAALRLLTHLTKRGLKPGGITLLCQHVAKMQQEDRGGSPGKG